MKIDIITLEKALAKVVDKLKFENISEIDINTKDYYWIVESPNWINMNASPTANVGSFIDDWESLKTMSMGSRPATFVDFDRVAAVLRLLSDELNPVKS